MNEDQGEEQIIEKFLLWLTTKKYRMGDCEGVVYKYTNPDMGYHNIIDVMKEYFKEVKK